MLLMYFVSVMDYDIPKNIEQCRAKLREEFDKHRSLKDVRVIDMLVIKVSVIDCSKSMVMFLLLIF